MSELTIRDQSGRQIGTADIGSRAMLWRDRAGTLRSMLDSELQRWIGHQQELVAVPGWHPDEPRLAATQQELLDLIVTVRDEHRY